MSQLIALIIAIALGAIVTALGYVFLGNAFANQSVKAEAQKILVQAEQIELAMIAYKVDNGGIIRLGLSDPLGNGCTDTATCSDNDIFEHLVADGYLKENINSTLTDSTLNWHYKSVADGGDGIVQRIVSEAEQCIEANHQKNGLPSDGITSLYVFDDGRSFTFATDITDGVPVCGTDAAGGIACCVTP